MQREVKNKESGETETQTLRGIPALRALWAKIEKTKTTKISDMTPLTTYKPFLSADMAKKIDTLHAKLLKELESTSVVQERPAKRAKTTTKTEK
eukprot:4252104-Amphidinium_carterae.1